MKAAEQPLIFGIIGDPVKHSRSPRMHNAALRQLGIDGVYVPFAVKTADLPHAIAGIRALGIRGVNVTVPHKIAVIPFLDSLTARARFVGAVNTVLNRHGHLRGDNTDVIGFIRSLQERGFRIRGRTAVIIGAGGSARAVVAGLTLRKARRIIIANRTLARARDLASGFSARTEIHAVKLTALRDRDLLSRTDLIVNTTSIGLHGERFLPLDWPSTPKHCLFYDLIYGKKTDFLRRASLHRRPVMDGLEMLLLQGAAAFELWTRRTAPIAVMRAAVRT